MPWSAWGEVVASAEQVERAGDTDRALDRLGLPAGLAGVHAALAGGRERDLAAALVSGGWRAAGVDQRRSLPVGCHRGHRAAGGGGRRGGGPRRGRARWSCTRPTDGCSSCGRWPTPPSRAPGSAPPPSRPRRSPPARSVRPSTWPRRLPRLPRPFAAPPPRRRRRHRCRCKARPRPARAAHPAVHQPGAGALSLAKVSLPGRLGVQDGGRHRRRGHRHG